MRFEDLSIGPKAAAKLLARGIEEWEAYEVWFNQRVIIMNRKDRAGSYRLVGRTDSGRPLTFPIRQREDAGEWEIVTGWESTKGERTIWRRRAR